jgi:methionyl-tRNA formyltransferase
VASVNFEKPVKDVYNLIRGCDPQPGAYTIYRGKRVRFYEAKISPSPVHKEPGEIVSIEEGSVQIAVKDGIVRIGKLRVDRGEKIGPAEFAESAGVKVGDRLGNN